MDRGGSREGGRPVNPPPPRHLLARTPRAASAGGEGCWGPPLRRRRPPLRASSGWGAEFDNYFSVRCGDDNFLTVF